jgi:hypothetical protein
MPLVTLTESQMEMAHVETLRLIADSEKRGLRHRFNHDESEKRAYDNHLQAAISEIAVSTFTGLPWTSCKGFKNSDVSGLEVRSQERKDGREYHLLVRDRDRDGRYVFCVVDKPNVVIAGWSTAHEVRTKGVLLYPDTDCYGLPRAELQPMWKLQIALTS